MSILKVGCSNKCGYVFGMAYFTDDHEKGKECPYCCSPLSLIEVEYSKPNTEQKPLYGTMVTNGKAYIIPRPTYRFE